MKYDLIEKSKKNQLLDASTEMPTPIEGSVAIDIPIDILWECFSKPNLWPRWNKCFFSAMNKKTVVGKELIWCFKPIKWYYPYLFPAMAKIVEVKKNTKVTWEVRIMPGFFARHTYFMEDLGQGKSRFGSWEKAYGPAFRLMKKFWIAHFEFVKNESLKGALYLEKVYKKTGSLEKKYL